MAFASTGSRKAWLGLPTETVPSSTFATLAASGMGLANMGLIGTRAAIKVFYDSDSADVARGRADLACVLKVSRSVSSKRVPVLAAFGIGIVTLVLGSILMCRTTSTQTIRYGRSGNGASGFPAGKSCDVILRTLTTAWT